MTATERAKRSDALYYETVSVNRRVLCDMVANREADLEDARAENAKLREELADAPKCETCEAMLDCDECLRADGSHKERRRLQAENAKLRELIRELFRDFANADYELKSRCGRTFMAVTRYLPRLQELEVEP